MLTVLSATALIINCKVGSKLYGIQNLTEEGTSSRVVWNNPEYFKEMSTANAVFQTGYPLDGKWYNVLNQGQLGDNLPVLAPCDWLYSEGSSFYWLPCGPTDDYYEEERRTDSGGGSSTGRSGNAQTTGMWMHNGNTNFYGGTRQGGFNSGCRTFALYIR